MCKPPAVLEAAPSNLTMADFLNNEVKCTQVRFQLWLGVASVTKWSYHKSSFCHVMLECIIILAFFVVVVGIYGTANQL